MNDFDPDTYLAEVEQVPPPQGDAGGFDPDAYLAEVEQQPTAMPEMPRMDPVAARNLAQLQSYEKALAGGQNVTLSDTGEVVQQEAPWHSAPGAFIAEAGNVIGLGAPKALVRSLGYDPEISQRRSPYAAFAGETAGAAFPSAIIGKAAKPLEVIAKSAGIGAMYGAMEPIAEKGIKEVKSMDVLASAAIGGAVGAVLPAAVGGVAKVASKFIPDAASLALRGMSFPAARGPELKNRVQLAIGEIAQNSPTPPKNAAETIKAAQDSIDILIARKDELAKNIPKADFSEIARKLEIEAQKYAAPENADYHAALLGLAEQIKQHPTRTFSDLENTLRTQNKMISGSSWNGIQWSPTKGAEANAREIYANELRALQKKLLEEAGDPADAEINKRISSLIDFKNGVAMKMMTGARQKPVGMVEAAALAHGIASTMAGDVSGGAIAIGMEISKAMNKQDNVLRRAFTKVIKQQGKTAMQMAQEKAATAAAVQAPAKTADIPTLTNEQIAEWNLRGQQSRFFRQQAADMSEVERKRLAQQINNEAMARAIVPGEPPPPASPILGPSWEPRSPSSEYKYPVSVYRINTQEGKVQASNKVNDMLKELKIIKVDPTDLSKEAVDEISLHGNLFKGLPPEKALRRAVGTALQEKGHKIPDSFFDK